MTRRIKKQKTQSEETEQASEKKWQGCWNYWTEGFKITQVNMLRSLMDKVNSMQEQMSNNSERQNN